MDKGHLDPEANRGIKFEQSRAIKHITLQNSMIGIAKDGTICMMELKCWKLGH